MRRKSPFPGMDPWLEDHWGDVHARLTTYTSDRLQPNLPTGLRARIEEYVTVESKFDDEEWRHRFVPDVVVTEPFRLSSYEQEGSVAVTTETEAVLLPREVEPPTL